MAALARELNEAEEPAKAVEPESWLARGAWFILFCGRPPNPFDVCWKIGAVFVRINEAWAIAPYSIRLVWGRERYDSNGSTGGCRVGVEWASRVVSKDGGERLEERRAKGG